jgi:hypothetical protein
MDYCTLAVNFWYTTRLLLPSLSQCPHPKLLDMAADHVSRFELARASPEDLHDLVKVEYLSFPPFIRETFMGCADPNDLPRLVEYYQRGLRNDSHTVWIKIFEKETGRVIAGSQWKVYPNYAPASSADDQPAEWLTGETLEKTVKLLDSMNKKRREANTAGYVHLHICYTHPDFR